MRILLSQIKFRIIVFVNSNIQRLWINEKRIEEMLGQTWYLTYQLNATVLFCSYRYYFESQVILINLRRPLPWLQEKDFVARMFFYFVLFYKFNWFIFLVFFAIDLLWHHLVDLIGSDQLLTNQQNLNKGVFIYFYRWKYGTYDDYILINETCVGYNFDTFKLQLTEHFF